MRYVVEDRKYQFKYAFDTLTGAYLRTGILNEKGLDTGVDPFMGSFPHLIDVGIMGHCVHAKTGLCSKAGIGCYQSGLFKEQPNMKVQDFEWIAKQCKGITNQFALGGRGDPDMHENFEEILKICRDNMIVPNYTTSGFALTDEKARISKKYCGAVGVSWHRTEYTYKAIETFLKVGMKTNIHYVLSKSSIDEAIQRLSTDDFPKGINAMMFLLHKPVGQGTDEDVLSPDDERIKTFFALLDEVHPYKIGMDSCTVPGAVNNSKSIIMETLDTCEAGRYSCCISADMIMTPCSFDQDKQYQVQLGDGTSVEDAWNSDEFEQFRDILRNNCPECKMRNLCFGGCPLKPQIVLCNKETKKLVNDKL